MTATARILSSVQRYRLQLQHREDQAIAALDHAYTQTLATIQPQLDKLYRDIAAMQQAGKAVPPSWLNEERRLARLKAVIEQYIGHYGTVAQLTTNHLQQQGVQLGSKAAMDMLEATVPGGVHWTFGVPSPHAMISLVGATQAGSPLADLFAGFGPEAAKLAADALTTGLGLGQNPRIVARQVQTALGISRNRALTICRSELNRAYRSAAVENYKANSDVVESMIRVADLSPRTCFPRGTMIQTRRGMVPIEQVRVGDEVLTHKGRYRSVYDTLQRLYAGEMVTVTSGGKSVVATANHPFLIERQGKLNWIEAGNIRLTDHVIRQFQGSSQISDHVFSDNTIEGRIRQANNAIASSLKPQCFLGVSLFDACLGMPIQAINFKAGIEGGQKKINGIAPALESMFLLIVNVERFKTKSSSAFWLGFPSEFAITANRAENPISLLSRTDAKLFPAMLATLDNRGATTLFRAVLIVTALLVKDFAAALTGDIGHLGHLAGIGTIDLPFLAWENREDLATDGTNLFRSLMLHPTLLCTIFSRSALLYAKSLAASFADHIKARLCLFPSSCMGIFSLMHPHATVGTEFPTASSYLSSGNVERVTTLNTNLFHSDIVTNIATHINTSVPVYNIEVQEDHSYVADGFVVHNCAACIALNGKVYGLDEDPGFHPNDRCALVPKTKDWSDILGGLGIDTSDIPSTTVQIQSGVDWFDAQDEETQQSILRSKAAYDLYSSGDAGLMDFVGHDHDADWGHSVYQRSAKDVKKLVGSR